MAGSDTAYAQLCDEDTERELLGCLLVDTDLRYTVQKLVRVDDFCLFHHRLIYKAIISSGDTPFYSISQALEDQPIIQEVGGNQFILDLMTFVENFANGLKHAEQVARLGKQRRILRMAESIAKAAISGKLTGLSKLVNRGLRYALFTPSNLRSVGKQIPLPGLLSNNTDEHMTEMQQV